MALQPALASNAQPALAASATFQPALQLANRQPALVSLSQPALVGYVFAP
jgi:hypothetical protein